MQTTWTVYSKNKCLNSVFLSLVFAASGYKLSIINIEFLSAVLGKNERSRVQTHFGQNYSVQTYKDVVNSVLKNIYSRLYGNGAMFEIIFYIGAPQNTEYSSFA